LQALPGAEFRVAKQQCDKVPDCHIVLGDRRLSITFKRLTERMSMLEKIRFGFNMIWESFNVSQQEIEDAKNKDMLQQIMAEMKENFPRAAEVILSERDTYLTAMLQATARSYQKVPKSINPEGKIPPVIVAIVGIGHQQGIVNLFDIDITSEELAQLKTTAAPQKESKMSYVYITISATIFGFALYKCLKRSCCCWFSKSNFSANDTLKSVKIA